MKRTDKAIYELAAKRLVEQGIRFSCHAIAMEEGCNYIQEQTRLVKKYQRKFKPEDYGGHAWFDNYLPLDARVKDQSPLSYDEHQLARSLALLFMAEMEK